MNYIDTISELNKYQSTHPVFVQLWTKYIDGKKKHTKNHSKLAQTYFQN